MNNCKIEVLVDSASTGVRLLVNRAQYDQLMVQFGWTDSHGTTMAMQLEDEELILFNPIKRATKGSEEALQALASNNPQNNANNEISKATDDAPGAKITPPNKSADRAKKAKTG